MNILKKFNSGLKKTSSFLSINLKNAISSKKINQEMLDEILIDSYNKNLHYSKYSKT